MPISQSVSQSVAVIYRYRVTSSYYPVITPEGKFPFRHMTSEGKIMANDVFIDKFLEQYAVRNKDPTDYPTNFQTNKLEEEEEEGVGRGCGRR